MSCTTTILLTTGRIRALTIHSLEVIDSCYFYIVVDVNECVSLYVLVTWCVYWTEDYDFLTRACPEGYFLGKLEPQHTELVTSYCSWFLDTPQIRHCFESMIKNYHNGAIFRTDNPTKPIGWVLQYPYGHLAHIYVLEEFRGKGLSMILRKKMCDWIITDGDLPQYVILKPNAITAHSTKVAGFIEMFQKKSLSVGLTKWIVYAMVPVAIILQLTNDQ